MKRVKFNGHSMSKFDMCYQMEDNHWRNLSWTVMSDAFTYSEVLDFFISYCTENDLTFVLPE